MKGFQFLMAVVVGVASVGYQQGWHKFFKSKSWQEVRPQDNSWVIELPGTPEVTSGFERLNQTDSITTTTWGVDFLNESYAFSVAKFSSFDMNKVDAEFDREAGYAGARQAALKRSNGSLIGEKDVTMGGYDAREFEISSPEHGMITIRVWNVGKMMYTTTIIHPLGGDDHRLAKDRIYDSFRLTADQTADLDL